MNLHTTKQLREKVGALSYAHFDSLHSIPSNFRDFTSVVEREIEKGEKGDWAVHRWLATLMCRYQRHLLLTHHAQVTRRIPRWLNRIITNGITDWSVKIHAVSTCMGKPWLDHHYFQKFPQWENFALVSEPYSLGLDELKEMCQFCEENNLSLHIDGESQHFTGRTFRITILPKKSKR